MSSRLRAFARLVTVAGFVAAYVALHLAITAGMDLRAHDRFRDAPRRATAFTAALDSYAAGDSSRLAEIRAGGAWFRDHSPPGDSRASVTSAAGFAAAGNHSLARDRVAGLVRAVERERAALQREFSSTRRAALCWAASSATLSALAWRLRRHRRSAAAELAELVSRFAAPRPWWRRPVFLTANAACCLLFTAGAGAVAAAEQQGHKMTLEVQLLLLIGGLGVLGAAGLGLRHTRPRAARGAAQALLQDGRRPVLYLRSFDDDTTTAQADDSWFGVNIHSREEQLAGALGTVGPVIAVGRPGEPLPKLGAARFYLPQDDWQPTVLRLMTLSRLIVLRLGSGDSLWWEIGQARATQPAHKLVLLAPNGLSGMAERLDQHLSPPSGLNASAVGTAWAPAVVAFGPDWTPSVYPVGGDSGADTSVPLVRRGARAVRTAYTTVTAFTPAYDLARALKAALASVGVRRRTMAWRAQWAAGAALLRGYLLITALALLSWLVFRSLQLFELA
ncbi:transferase [Streptomyces sp. LHD-70]|uniref:transferase n=1 Tax=Streptomyces sp. LHD-70 TaxID=3072140 RepID=UPI00280E1C60|nr:transferase [Streptomyces sp. LHD-70]MDQ8704718.1 transferase [Streptomyces sp. LHD-70]